VALGENQVAEPIASAKGDGFETSAIAIALELKFVGREHFRPWS
jgi:hypothetical protein